MEIAFEKMHANGDDFLVIDARGRQPVISDALVRALADRNRGVGFNQLAVLTDCDDAAARIAFWNADGSTLGACGSATRGVAQRLMDETGSSSVTVRTARGLLAGARAPDGRVSVEMGRPLLLWTDVPLAREMDTLELPLQGAPAACSMGNPHCTFFVADIDSISLEARGRQMERDPLFPQGTNVHFVQVLSPSRIRLRIWERGAGISPGSGSCACGAVVNGIRRGLLAEEVDVQCDGGDLGVRWDGRGTVMLTGAVESVFSGIWRG